MPPLLVACVKPSLEVFQAAGGVRSTRKKSLLLTAYLEMLLGDAGLLEPHGAACHIDIVTPSDPSARGCQLSLRVVPGADAGTPLTMHALNELLEERGVVADTREPDIIRVAPAPLYNSFADVLETVQILRACLATEGSG